VRASPSDFDTTPVVTKSSANVTSVKWSRNPTDLQAEDVAYYELTLRLKVNDVPFTRVPFTITQVCRPKNGTSLDDVTVVWASTSPESRWLRTDSCHVTSPLRGFSHEARRALGGGGAVDRRMRWR